MKTMCQIVVYVVSLFGVCFLGNLFETAFWQVGVHLRKLFPGRPLPAITEFFIEHRQMHLYLMLLPWICFVGLPLLTTCGSRNYWNTLFFLLRWVAFFSSELFICLVLSVALAIPFVPYYFVLEMPHETTLEFTVRFVCLALLAACLLGGSARIYQLRKRLIPN